MIRKTLQKDLKSSSRNEMNEKANLKQVKQTKIKSLKRRNKAQLKIVRKKKKKLQKKNRKKIKKTRAMASVDSISTKCSLKVAVAPEMNINGLSQHLLCLE
jgi:hypothetical protein